MSERDYLALLGRVLGTCGLLALAAWYARRFDTRIAALEEIELLERIPTLDSEP